MARRLVGLGIALTLVAGGASVAPRGLAQTSATCSVPTALPSPPANRPHYALTVHVSRGLMVVDGTLAVAFTPDVSTDRLVFRLWPNSPVYSKHGAALSVGQVREGGRLLSTAQPNPTTLVVRRPVAAHARV